MAKVIFKTPDGKSREVKLKQRNTLGRHPGQDIQILDRVVSKAHAVIECQDNHYFIYDVGSRNGTILNGQLVTRRTELKMGDEVTLGSTSIHFEPDAPAAPPPVPAAAVAQAPTMMGGGVIQGMSPQLGANSAGAAPPSGRYNDRVTIQQDAQTAIRRLKEAETSSTFLPEAKIKDVDALRRDYEKLRIAVELNQSVGVEFDLDELLSKILDKAFEIFMADRGVILLKADPKNTTPKVSDLLPRIVRSRHAGDNVDNIRISQTILREVVEEKAAVLSSDAMMDARFSGAHSIILDGIRSAISVPLLYGQEVLGAIHLDTQLAAGAFTEKDLQLLMGFSRQAAVNVKHQQLIGEMERTILARDKLNRLLSPHLVDEVLSGRLELTKGGDKRIATVLFSDIRGFTSATERSNAESIVAMLNEYFEVMVELIFQYEGTLDKFVGDEIMALWGAPVAHESHAINAILCALDMFEALGRLNEERLRAGKEPIDIGIGIATGEMIAGYMGSTKAMDYTVIGDTVNLGARLCSAAGPGEILINSHAYDLVKDDVEVATLPPVRVKGKAEPVKLYRVMSRKRARPDAVVNTAENHSPFR
jgi:adenylate cyclase